MSSLQDLIKRIKYRDRKYKWKLGNSQSKDRNFNINGKQKHIRPDLIVLKGKRRVGINKVRGRFDSDECFDEEGV